MKDLRDIDSFFNGEKNFIEEDGVKVTPRVRVLRFLKLAMPSVAAVLVALILLFPSLKKNTVADIDITLPKTGELEKLHIEQTEFSITDKQNKVSHFTADRIDETEPGSKLMKIINPKGSIPTGENDQVVRISADTGYYNQSLNKVHGEQNVKAVYDDGTTVMTEKAAYDFNKAVGNGDDDVYAFGSWGELWAEGFEYHQNQALLILTGKSKILKDGRTLNASDQIRYYRLQNKMEAQGNVVVIEPGKKLFANKMIAYFEEKDNRQIKKIEAFGNVFIKTEEATAKADSAVYLPHQSEIELRDNVVIEQDGNVIFGSKAITNLETSESRVFAGDAQKKRVSGVIKGSALKGKKHEKE